MKIIKQFPYAIILFFFLSGCSSQSSMIEKINKTLNKTTKTSCEEKGGYWYNTKCWATFAEYDDGILDKDIEAVVDKILLEAEEYKLTINGKSHDIGFFFVEENPEDKQTIMISTYTDKDGVKTMLQIIDNKNLKKKTFPLSVIVIKGNLIEMDDDEQSNFEDYIISNGTLEATVVDKEKMKYRINGTLKDMPENELTISMLVGEEISGLGDTKLEIKGNEVYLNGTLGTRGYAQFRDLIKNHPEVTTIVLQNVPGSINDAVNMHTGRIIREAGLNTKVLADSQISSGGVDLFCAGKERIVTKGARLGIHSWGGEGVSADDFAKDHPAHQYQLAHFTMCLGKEKGPSFYFRTLEAAPAGDMHWMSDAEIKQWTVSTQFLNN